MFTEMFSALLHTTETSVIPSPTLKGTHVSAETGTKPPSTPARIDKVVDSGGWHWAVTVSEDGKTTQYRHLTPCDCDR